MVNRLQVLWLLVAGLLLCGCVAYEPVDLAEVHWAVRAHDVVRITKQDGHRIELTVTFVTDEEIVGKEGKVELQEIDVLKRKPRYDSGHVLVTIGVLITAMIFA